MIKFKTAPQKIKILLAICLVGTMISIGTIFWVYSATRTVAQSIGRDTVPSIIAARNIRATLAAAHSNAMNAMATKERPGGKFWNLYRKDLNLLHSQLIEASKNITFGEEERGPIFTILSNISAYEYTVGGAVANGAEISVDQFMEANRLMQQKILPASTALGRTNLSKLDSIYESYTKNFDTVMAFMQFVAFALLILLFGTQLFLFKKTHRIFNKGLLLAAILFSFNLYYSTKTLNSVKEDLYVAKQEAFDSLNTLWSARAEAHNAKAMQSLYLLHNGTGIVQSADTINFNLSVDRMSSDGTSKEDSSKGFLTIALENTTFEGEDRAVQIASQQWEKYVQIDKQIRNLEYDNKHNEAITLFIGDSDSQANYEFARFDAALDETISVNQKAFDESITSVFRTLNMFPYITAAFLLTIIIACILGLKARIDEYRI
jgi:hypothetical protein